MSRVGLAVIGVVASALLGGAVPASAHFQMLYPGESARMRGGALDLLMVFTHPFNGGPTMKMEKPNALYVITQRGSDGEKEKIDLLSLAEPFEFVGGEKDTGTAYRAAVPATRVRSLGDYVFVLEPAPYLEESEDKYIQQFTKTIVNVGGVPGNWDQTFDLPTEIRPLNKPYANWTGGVFRGVVLSAGKPVPFAEIEVEFVNRTPGKQGWTGKPQVKAPHPSLGGQSIRADANGGFAVGLPRAGWWGIGALNVGPVKEHKGKKLSQDAVIWVQVTTVK